MKAFVMEKINKIKLEKIKLEKKKERKRTIAAITSFSTNFSSPVMYLYPAVRHQGLILPVL